MVAGELSARGSADTLGVARPREGTARPLTDPRELRARYEAYRRRQVARLVQMLPKEAIRPLYRRARAGYEPATASSVTVMEELHDDPLALLMDFCERVLPLPPFELWQQDLERHPDAHLADLEDSAHGPTADAPSTIDARRLTYGGRPWLAHLRAFRDSGLWRGFIAFEDEESGRIHRTAVVFCEGGLGELRERFVRFEMPALEAFLRSALP